MAISGSPPIKFSQIQTEWTGTSNFLAYVKGGTYVKSTDTGVTSVNTAAPLKMLQFLGAAKSLGPTFVAAGTFAQTPGQPAGITTNDILVMLATGATTTPAGWTLKVTGNELKVFWQRYAGVGSPTLAAGRKGQISAFRGCITSGDPFNAFGTVSEGEGAESASSSPGSITTSVNNCLILALIGGRETDGSGGSPSGGGSVNSITGPATTSTSAGSSNVNTTSGYGVNLYRGVLATAGATGAGSITMSYTIENYGYVSAVLGALRPP
jgi:hypothetical protein